MPSQIFISYSRVDRDYVDRLAKHLRDAGLEVWYDQAISIGDRFATVIQRQIADASVVMVVMTPSALASDWVHRETNYAVQRRKPLMPLLLKPCEDIPMLLADLNYIDVSDGSMPEPSVMARIHDLSGTREQVLTPPGARARFTALTAIQRVVADLLHCSPEAVTPSMSFVEDLSIRSLDAVKIASQIETLCGVRIPEEELDNVRTVNDAAYLVATLIEARRHPA